MAVYMNGNEIGNFSMTRIGGDNVTESNVFVITATIPEEIANGLAVEIEADKTVSEVLEAVRNGSLIFVRLTGNYTYENAILNPTNIIDYGASIDMSCDTIIGVNRVYCMLYFPNEGEDTSGTKTITITKVL